MVGVLLGREDIWLVQLSSLAAFKDASRSRVFMRTGFVGGIMGCACGCTSSLGCARTAPGRAQGPASLVLRLAVLHREEGEEIEMFFRARMTTSSENSLRSRSCAGPAVAWRTAARKNGAERAGVWRPCGYPRCLSGFAQPRALLARAKIATEQKTSAAKNRCCPGLFVSLVLTVQTKMTVARAHNNLQPPLQPRRAIRLLGVEPLSPSHLQVQVSRGVPPRDAHPGHAP